MIIERLNSILLCCVMNGATAAQTVSPFSNNQLLQASRDDLMLPFYSIFQPDKVNCTIVIVSFVAV